MAFWLIYSVIVDVVNRFFFFLFGCVILELIDWFIIYIFSLGIFVLFGLLFSFNFFKQVTRFIIFF